MTIILLEMLQLCVEEYLAYNTLEQWKNAKRINILLVHFRMAEVGCEAYSLYAAFENDNNGKGLIN